MNLSALDGTRAYAPIGRVGTLANRSVCTNGTQAYGPVRPPLIHRCPARHLKNCSSTARTHTLRTGAHRVLTSLSDELSTLCTGAARRTMVQLLRWITHIMLARPLTSDETRDETAARGRGPRTRRIRLAASGAPHLRKARMCGSSEQGNSEVLQRALLCDRPRAACATAPVRPAVEPARDSHDPSAQSRTQPRQQSRGRDLTHR
jgi:hypothetical protein